MFEYEFKMAGNTATMIIINRKTNEILLGKRSDDSDAFAGWWSLPGGFLNVGDERLKTVASRETMEECDLTIDEDAWTIFYIDDEPRSDPRYDQVVNNCFYAFIGDEEAATAKPGDDLQELKWVNTWQAHQTELAFAHNEIVMEFMLKTPQEKVKNFNSKQES